LLIWRTHDGRSANLTDGIQALILRVACVAACTSRRATFSSKESSLAQPVNVVIASSAPAAAEWKDRGPTADNGICRLASRCNSTRSHSQVLCKCTCHLSSGIQMHTILLFWHPDAHDPASSSRLEVVALKADLSATKADALKAAKKTDVKIKAPATERNIVSSFGFPMGWARTKLALTSAARFGVHVLRLA